MDRRSFVTTSLGALVAAHMQPQSDAAPPNLASLWDVDRSIANLENAYWGVMPREINDEYLEQTRFLNRRNVAFVRDAIADRERTVAMDHVRAEVARLMKAPKEEFALTRNGTEALQNLIMQYGRLKPGDAVMYADLDYDEMQQAMASLEHYRSARVLTFAIPEPATTANILAAYGEQLKKAPANLKLLLITHLSNRTGVVMPVKEIVAMARADHRPSRLHARRFRRGLRRLLAAQVALCTDRHWRDLDSQEPPSGYRDVHGQHPVAAGRHPIARQCRHGQLRRRAHRAQGDRVPRVDRRPPQAGVAAGAPQPLGEQSARHSRHGDPDARRTGTLRRGDELPAAGDEGLRGRAADGEDSVGQVSDSDGRAPRHNEGVRCARDANAV